MPNARNPAGTDEGSEGMVRKPDPARIIPENRFSLTHLRKRYPRKKEPGFLNIILPFGPRLPGYRN
jgi:hypothetical protein